MTSMPSSGSVLDSLLVLLAPAQPELHLHAAVLEVAEPALLAELASDARIRRYLLGRLSDTVALVDPGHAEDLEKALLASGHTPKVLQGDAG